MLTEVPTLPVDFSGSFMTLSHSGFSHLFWTDKVRVMHDLALRLFIPTEAFEKRFNSVKIIIK